MKWKCGIFWLIAIFFKRAILWLLLLEKTKKQKQFSNLCRNCCVSIHHYSFRLRWCILVSCCWRPTTTTWAVGTHGSNDGRSSRGSGSRCRGSLVGDGGEGVGEAGVGDGRPWARDIQLDVLWLHRKKKKQHRISYKSLRYLPYPQAPFSVLDFFQWAILKVQGLRTRLQLHYVIHKGYLYSRSFNPWRSWSGTVAIQHPQTLTKRLYKRHTQARAGLLSFMVEQG